MSCRYLTSDLLNCLNGLARCLAYLDVDFTFKPLASLCGSRIDRERERERGREKGARKKCNQDRRERGKRRLIEGVRCEPLV